MASGGGKPATTTGRVLYREDVHAAGAIRHTESPACDAERPEATTVRRANHLQKVAFQGEHLQPAAAVLGDEESLPRDT